MKIIFLEGKNAQSYYNNIVALTYKGDTHFTTIRNSLNMGYYKNERGKWICFDNRDGEMHTSVEFSGEDCLRWLTQRVENEGVR